MTVCPHISALKMQQLVLIIHSFEDICILMQN